MDIKAVNLQLLLAGINLGPIRILDCIAPKIPDHNSIIVRKKVNLSKPSIATPIPFEAFLGGHIDCFSLMPYYQHANGKFYDRIAIGPSASGKTGVMFYGKIVYKSHFIKNAWEKEK